MTGREAETKTRNQESRKEDRDIVEDSEKLKVCRWNTFVDVSTLWFKAGEC